MKKSTLLRQVSAETGVPYAVVKRVVDTTLADIIESLQRGERVVLSGFGTFGLRPYRARQWVNPQTGREIDIPAALRPGFVSSAALKRRLIHEGEEGSGQGDMAAPRAGGTRVAGTTRSGRRRRVADEGAQSNSQ